MKRWGAKGFWAETGCWLFLFSLSYICAFIVFSLLLFKKPPNADEKREKENGEVELDVEAGWGNDASADGRVLRSAEGQVKSCG